MSALIKGQVTEFITEKLPRWTQYPPYRETMRKKSLMAHPQIIITLPEVLVQS